jgi:fibrillarin-like rRNA methylase
MKKMLETLFPKTMHRYWWNARTTGKTYGVNLALYVLHEEMKQVHKDTEVAPLAVNARLRAKYLQTLIRKVKALNDVK